VPIDPWKSLARGGSKGTKITSKFIKHADTYGFPDFPQGFSFLGVEDGRQAVPGGRGAKLHEDSQFYRVSHEGHGEDVSDEVFVVSQGGGVFDGTVQRDQQKCGRVK